MKRKYFWLLLILLVCTPVIANQVGLFQAGDNLKTAVVYKGQLFTIQLDSNPTTGFDWHLVKINNKYVKQVASGYNQSSTKLVGAGGQRWFKLKLVAVGRTSLTLSYYRIWEGPQKAVNNYALNLLIKERPRCVK